MKRKVIMEKAGVSRFFFNGCPILNMGSIAETGTKTFDDKNDYRFFQAGTIIFTTVSRFYYLDKKV